MDQREEPKRVRVIPETSGDTEESSATSEAEAVASEPHGNGPGGTDKPVETSSPPSRRGSRDERVRPGLFVVGRRGGADDPRALLRIGRYVGPDGSLGFDVHVDASTPHVVLVCGKRGYGKSYTMGTILEEFVRLAPEERDRIAPVVVDTLGVFWTMAHANDKQRDVLEEWGMVPEGVAVDVLTMRSAVDRFNKEGIPAEPLVLPLGSLEAHDFASLFDLPPSGPAALLLARVLDNLKEANDGPIGFEDLEAAIDEEDPRPEVRDQLRGMVGALRGWGVFDREGTPVEDLLRPGRVVLLDVSPIADEAIKVVVASVLGRRFFDYRVRAKKEEDAASMAGRDPPDHPLVWLTIDEAQVFLPAERHTPAKETFIAGWMRQGRQPGLSLLLATQRVAALDAEVLSHADIFVCHRVTAQDDIAALDRIRPGYMQGSLGDEIGKLGTSKGIALVVDDVTESVHTVRIRPRLSWHGGEAPDLLK